MARRYMLLAWGVSVLLSTVALAGTPLNPPQADALLSIDQHRATVIDRIVRDWGDQLATSSAALRPDQLRTMLNGLRADQLLAASLAGTLDGLRNVLAVSATPSRVQTKALGDSTDDLVYTPVTPCRLFDTRPSQGGLGVMQPNVRRTYGAVTPVASQGGPGGCGAPIGAAVALIQIGTLTPSANGYLQGGAQGVASFPNALLLYQPGDQYGTSIAMPLNVANGQFDVQVQFGATDLYGDLLGYFRAPSGQYFKQGGNTFGATAKLGTLDNQPVEIYVNNQRVMRYEPDATSPKVVGGHPNNVALASGATVAGGGIAGNCDTPGGGPRPCANQATGANAFVGAGEANLASGAGSTVGGGLLNAATGPYSTVPGGGGNNASGLSSFAAGQNANAIHANSFVWSDGTTYYSEGDRHFTVHAQAVEFEGLESGHTAWIVLGRIAGQLIGTSSGGYLTDAGVWQSASDRNKKERFVPIDPQRVLARLVELPVMQWNYKAEPDVLRMGPVAQDFHAAFGLGPDDLTIAQTDESGVAFAAIQGLHQLVQEKDARIRTLEQQISELQSLRGELAALRAMVTVLPSTKDKIADP